ncbi:hypothetical protein HAX54_041516, partial [Datura stramonium]|nr:hypothetical protein [Datura stramonium]
MELGEIGVSRCKVCKARCEASFENMNHHFDRQWPPIPNTYFLHIHFIQYLPSI